MSTAKFFLSMMFAASTFGIASAMSVVGGSLLGNDTVVTDMLGVGCFLCIPLIIVMYCVAGRKLFGVQSNVT